MIELSDDEILHFEDMSDRKHGCRQTIYNKVARGTLPKPIKPKGDGRPFWTGRMLKQHFAKLEAEAAA